MFWPSISMCRRARKPTDNRYCWILRAIASRTALVSCSAVKGF
jgi:hypothetical protein